MCLAIHGAFLTLLLIVHSTYTPDTGQASQTNLFYLLIYRDSLFLTPLSESEMLVKSSEKQGV